MRNSAGVADAAEARGGVHERARFLEPVPAPRGASRDGDGDDAEHVVEITLDSPSYAHGARRARIQQVSQEVRALASSRRRRGGPGSADGLTFVGRADASAGWAAVERRFDEEATDGLLHRSKFAKCIGMKELAFAGGLLDALAHQQADAQHHPRWRRRISGDSISKPEMLELWDQISDHSFDSRLHTFIDM
ncbi:hypothetical protein ZWY2020_044704 [Hordeum vulgare]|nr:hypothetical protein ZWY2020_044704 [Hordeum vulgare]